MSLCALVLFPGRDPFTMDVNMNNYVKLWCSQCKI